MAPRARRLLSRRHRTRHRWPSVGWSGNRWSLTRSSVVPHHSQREPGGIGVLAHAPWYWGLAIVVAPARFERATSGLWAQRAVLAALRCSGTTGAAPRTRDGSTISTLQGFGWLMGGCPGQVGGTEVGHAQWRRIEREAVPQLAVLRRSARSQASQPSRPESSRRGGSVATGRV